LWAIRWPAAAEDMAGGAVVALELDDLGAGEIVLEAQDVVDLGAAPAIDRLVVVADAADVWLRRGPSTAVVRWSRPAERRSHMILRDVGVLVLVDQDVAEASGDSSQHIRMLAEQRSDAAAGRRSRGVQRLQPVLIGGVELAALAVGEGAASPSGHVRGRQTAVLPAVDHAGQHPAGQRFSSMPSAWISCLISRTWSSVSRMVKSERSPTSSAWRRRSLAADGVEGAEPGHALDGAADEMGRCAPSSRAPPCW
jgi:hypothetical protein